MKKWLINQLTEPTAWAGATLIVSILFFPDWFSIMLCVILILMDEAAMKAWCARQAPGIAAKIEEWTRP